MFHSLEAEAQSIGCLRVNYSMGFRVRFVIGIPPESPLQVPSLSYQPTQLV